MGSVLVKILVDLNFISILLYRHDHALNKSYKERPV